MATIIQQIVLADEKATFSVLIILTSGFLKKVEFHTMKNDRDFTALCDIAVHF